MLRIQGTWMLLLCIFLSFTDAALAQGPVWKISSGPSTLYLGGTIHVLAESDYPLPETFEQAYQKASKIVFETDLNRLKQSSFQRQAQTYLRLKDGQSLDQILKPKTLEKLKKYFATRDIPWDSVSNYSVGMLSNVISMTELQRFGIHVEGVDQHYNTRATQDGKVRSHLETPLSQIELIASMGKGREDEFINNALDELPELPQMIDDIRLSWRTGDTKKLYDTTLKTMQQEFPEMYQQWIAERNNQWLNSIEKMLKTPQTELMLVGAAHLVGSDGLLKQLQQRGYSVEQL